MAILSARSAPSIPPFSIVVAAAQNGGIGQNGGLPWRLPRDMAFFKQLTTHGFMPTSACAAIAEAAETKNGVQRFENAVIMGRKTWDSIPPKFRPLPGRINVVLTRQGAEHIRDSISPEQGFYVHVASDFDAALAWLSDCRDASRVNSAAAHAVTEANPARLPQVNHVFVIGGAQIYATALAHPACTHIFRTNVTLPTESVCDTVLPSISPRFVSQPHAALEAAAGTAIADGEQEDAASGLKYRFELLSAS